MTINVDRRLLLQLSLLAAFPVTASVESTRGAASAAHAFDFFFGTWQVRHRRLHKRLANSNDWEEFDGTTHCQPILGGFANMNDSVVRRGSATYRGLGLRAFNPESGTWADWYLDGREPTRIEIHGTGRFAHGVGTFLADDTFEGKPIKVRGIFTPLTPTTMQWEQAFSPDGGTSWETNYVMRYTRTK